MTNKTTKLPSSKPRNFVAKNATSSGAGAHTDKKKALKQGDQKHKGQQYAESADLSRDPYYTHLQNLPKTSPKKQFTSMEIAMMEGGHSIDPDPLRKQQSNESYTTYLNDVLEEMIKRK